MASCVLAASAWADGTVPLVINTVKPAQTVIFKDETGAAQTLKPEQHKLSAVHFWATWCVPCIAELPEVNAAQQVYGEKGFQVYALSLDGEANMAKVKAFLAEHKIEHLKPYIDPNFGAFKKASLLGLPATLFIDAKGQEVARADGILKWKSDETKKFIESHLK